MHLSSATSFWEKFPPMDKFYDIGNESVIGLQINRKLIEEEKNNQSTEKQEEDALVLWDSVSIFDTLEEGSLKQEKTSETNVTTRSQALVK